MRTLQPERIAGLLRHICLVIWLLGFGTAPQGFAQASTPNSSVHGVPVFVSDFELYAAEARANAASNAPAQPAKPTPSSAVVYDDADLPSVQARRLMDFFTASLLQALNQKEFSAKRAEGQKAPAGVLIRGVFAEPDARNRIRRALLGSNSPGARFFLYVGIFNATRQDQPLYQLAGNASQGERYGPVITLNAYVPLAKYELDKNPSEEDVRKICNQIAASLVSLLEKNSDAFSQ
jgi:hypothetical protein